MSTLDGEMTQSSNPPHGRDECAKSITFIPCGNTVVGLAYLRDLLQRFTDLVIRRPNRISSHIGPTAMFISRLVRIVGFAEPHLAPDAGERRVDLLRPMLRPGLARLAYLAEYALQRFPEIVPVNRLPPPRPLRVADILVGNVGRNEFPKTFQRRQEIALDARNRPIGDAPKRIVSLLVMAGRPDLLCHARCLPRNLAGRRRSPSHGLTLNRPQQPRQPPHRQLLVVAPVDAS